MLRGAFISFSRNSLVTAEGEVFPVLKAGRQFFRGPGWRAFEEGERTSKNVVEQPSASAQKPRSEFFNFSHRAVEPVATSGAGWKLSRQKARSVKKGNKRVGGKSRVTALLGVTREPGRGKASKLRALILPPVNRGWFELLITRYLRNDPWKEEGRKSEMEGKRRRGEREGG